MNKILRADCDTFFPDGSCLRKIAVDIASESWDMAKAHGLLTASSAPFNLLSNGETSGGWTLPTQITPNDLLEWKYAANGFVGPTNRGLSLLFDPFVDACLLIEAEKTSRPFEKPTNVLVLTDYYPLKHVIGEMSVLQGQDWAEVATSTFFKAEGLGATGNNLFKALFGGNISIEDVRVEIGNDPKVVSQIFGKYRLLIWNYFPFFRGGINCSGMSGLPQSKSDWIEYCDGLLLKFLKCVNATKVVYSINSEVKDLRRKCQNPSKQQIEKDYPAPRQWLDLYHPSRWEKDMQGKELREFLLD